MVLEVDGVRVSGQPHPCTHRCEGIEVKTSWFIRSGLPVRAAICDEARKTAAPLTMAHHLQGRVRM